jgi:hypothetical protein
MITFFFFVVFLPFLVVYGSLFDYFLVLWFYLFYNCLCGSLVLFIYLVVKHIYLQVMYYYSKMP